MEASTTRYGKSLASVILVAFVCLLIVSCAARVDISGHYKGKMAIIDGSEREQPLEEIEIILNQKGKNISGSLIFPAGTIEIESGVIRGNEVNFIAIKKGKDPNLMEYEIEVKFDGRIKGKVLDGSFVWKARGVKVVGSFPDVSAVPASETYEGTLTATRENSKIATRENSKIATRENSKIAANESAAVADCKVYATAQETFRRSDWDADGIREYALAIGKRGLKHYADVVKPEEGREEANTLFDCRGNFLDEWFVAAEGGGEDARPKGGYFFKCLHGQDKPGDFLTAPPGSKVKNNLTRCYGLLAWPAKYDTTGRQVFFIETKGTVYARDFGSQEATLEFVKSCRTIPPNAELGVEWLAAE